MQCRCGAEMILHIQGKPEPDPYADEYEERVYQFLWWCVQCSRIALESPGASYVSWFIPEHAAAAFVKLAS